MSTEVLFAALRRRASDPLRRTDVSPNPPVELAPPATEGALTDAEGTLGFALHELHRRLLGSIGNGGFGPGFGFLGVAGGRLDDDGNSLVALRAQLLADFAHEAPIVPLWDWGSGTWACLDARSGQVVILDDEGATDTQVSLHECLQLWVSGVELSERLFEFHERELINPFTRQPSVHRLRGRALGVRYLPST